MIDTWSPYKKVDFKDTNILQYHIDTRDFHCLTLNYKYKGDKKPIDIKTISKYPERFYYTPDEILLLIDRYFIDSGGEKKWRYFNLEQASNWSLKYIRIYRIDNNLIMCNRDNYALKKDITNSIVDKDKY